MELHISRGAVHWPAACACCGAPVSDSRLHIRGSRGAFLLVAAYEEVLTIEVPYCRSCVDHAKAFEKGTFGGLLYPSALVMAGAFLVGMLGLAVIGEPSRSTELALMLGAPVLAPVLYIVARLAIRHGVAIGPPHATKGPAVRVVSWNAEAVLLSFSSEAYATLLVSKNRLHS